MHIKKYLPNAITCMNLLAGSIAITYVFNDKMHISAILVCIAAVLDYLDGFTARLMNVYSTLGKELDSLADLVTFGLTPSLVLFQFIMKSNTNIAIDFYGVNLLAFSGFLIVIFSAIRLAKYNIDSRQSFSFIGLPTPANGLFIMSIPLILHYADPDTTAFEVITFIVSNALIVVGMAIVLSFLLVSGLPLFSLKFKNYNFDQNKIRYYFLGGIIIMLIFLGLYAIPLTIIFYIVLSVCCKPIIQNGDNAG